MVEEEEEEEEEEEDEEKRPRNYNIRVPRRYRVAFMLNSGLALCITYRLILSLAMIEMTKNLSGSNTTQLEKCISSQLADYPYLVNERQSSMDDWNCPKLQGFVKASFFPGYIISHVPGGYASDAFGGSFLFSIGVLISGLLTIASPFCIQISPYLYIANRFLQGVSQGPLFAALNSLLAQWSPPQERTRLSVFSNLGIVIGQVFGNTLVGLILHWFDSWASSFYIFGALCIPWTFLWFTTVSDSPRTSSSITPEEKEFILSSIGDETSDIVQHKSVPWKQLFLSVPFWVLVLVNFGQDWGFYTINVNLPLFMHDVLHFNIYENGLVNALPWLILFFVTSSTAFMADWIILKSYASKTFTRKSFATLASVGSAVFMVGASYAGHSRVITVLMFVLSVSMFGFVYVSVWVNTLDIAPNFAGIVFAFVNGIGGFAGIFSPLLIGYLIVEGSVEEWQICFWIVANIMVVTLIPFLLFGSAEVQPWNELNVPARSSDSK